MSVDSYRAVASCMMSSGDYSEAVALLRRAIEIDSESPALYADLSAAYLLLNRAKEALESSKRCLLLDPNRIEGYYRKFRALIACKSLSEVISTANTIIGDSYDSNSVTIDLEDISEPVFSKDIEDIFGEEQFQSFLKSDPLLRKRVARHLAILEKEPSVGKDLFLKFATLESVMFLDHFLEVMSSTDDDMKGSNIKEDEVQISDDGNVKQDFFTSSPQVADVWKEKGNKLYKEKKFEEALSAYKNAIMINPGNYAYILNMTAVYLEMTDYAKCIKICESLIEKRSELKIDFVGASKVFSRMATCYRRQNDYVKAIEMYEKALVEDNNHTFRTALNEVKALKVKKEEQEYFDSELANKHREAGNVYFKENKLQEAKKEYDEGIKRNPQDAKLYANRAAVLIKLGDYPMALKDVTKSLELDPNVSKVWARKGYIQVLMKDYNRAVNSYTKGLEVDKENVDCQTGLQQVLCLVEKSASSDSWDKERMQKALEDPEIVEILRDPQMSIILQQFMENPSSRLEGMKDPKVLANISKLVCAGLIRFG